MTITKTYDNGMELYLDSTDNIDKAINDILQLHINIEQSLYSPKFSFVTELADILEECNDNFDRDKFFKACYDKKEDYKP